MPRYRLQIEFDGTPYRGWQRQAGSPSVQQAIEEAIEQFAQHKVTLFGAGRTDTGVHATGQVAHVDLDRDWAPEKVIEAANGILRQRSETIAVTACDRVGEDFDARFSATRRHYRYRIVNRLAPLALDRHRAWWVRFPLDAGAMHEAAQLLVGHHDFTTFRTVNCQAKSPMKTLERLDVVRHEDDEIEVTAVSRSFLHNQVRSMVGTLKLVGDGKWPIDQVRTALEAKDRTACGPVAPAHGLYLTTVEY